MTGLLYQVQFPRTIAPFLSAMPLKLATLNVERSKHLDLVLPFLAEQKFDVVCLQELMERDISRFKEIAGENFVFAPMTRWVKEGPPTVIGVGVFSPHPLKHSAAQYYHGSADILATFDETSIDTKAKTVSNPLLVADIEKEEVVYRIVTTHFSWTPDGSAS
ncbi:endonuclease/exonuclease/phosphatase family protein, partial [Candidatus Parcubacteria bacterium]